MIIKLLNLKDECYPQVSNFALLAFSVYVIIWYLQVGIRIPALGAIRIEFLWAIFLIVLILQNKEKVYFRNNPMTGITFLFFIVVAIQVPFSFVPAQSWEVFFNRFVKFSIMTFFIVYFVRSPKGLIFFIGAFLIACMKMGQEGFWGQITGSMVWENQEVMRLHGSTPNYAHPNSFSGMAIGTIPFLIFLFPISTKLIKGFFLVQLIFAVNIILHSGSRTGYFGFLIMAAVFFFISNNKKRILIIFLIFVFLVIPFINTQYKERFLSIFAEKEEIGFTSRDKRIEIIKDSLDIFIEYPFGIGVSAFPYIRNLKFGRSQDTHNLYLEIATNIGIQGLLIFMVFIYKMLKCLIKIKKSFKIQRFELFEKYDLLKNNQMSETYYKVNVHIWNLKLFEAVANATFLFICARLALGLFGMDLYEIYWWFGLGLTVSLWNMNLYARKYTNNLLY